MKRLLKQILILFFVILLVNLNAFSEPGSIGGNKDILKKILIDTTSYPLVQADIDKNRMLLVESIKILKEEKAWILKIKDDAEFSDNSLLTLADVIWSLEKCKKDGVFASAAGFEKYSREPLFKDGKFLKIRFSENQEYQKIIDQISKCPVFQKNSMELFGDDFLTGTNVISSGRYQVSDFKEGKFFTLRLVKHELDEKKYQVVELRIIDKAEEGLSLLRSGTLLIYFTEDASVLAKAATDETLKTGNCQGYSFAARADLNYDCQDTFDLYNLG